MITGYRTQMSTFSKLLQPFKMILEYETKELGNKDIYYTLRERYNLQIDLRKSVDSCNEIVVNFFQQKFHGVEPLAVWLCDTVENVRDLYLKYGNILEVFLPNSAIVASDLGREGKLYVIDAGSTYSWRVFGGTDNEA